ncbi:hypothetical protein G6N74_13655 [Mesorhizobium sp. CGMCC 1.15528]|uniref:Uncharacterized protein n=1 Tax=Mesorhizobium zhangyense TaxID=1776730 RepID=A0A7C9VDH3_9HYPH|nr:hypothetical protein [Mesorhizobium zhangyense]NGN42111.1 hypothetical protein [Mesorhizobium zhangyense]
MRPTVFGGRGIIRHLSLTARLSSRGESFWRLRHMWDFILVALGIVSFGLFYAYALGCNRL